MFYSMFLNKLLFFYEEFDILICSIEFHKFYEFFYSLQLLGFQKVAQIDNKQSYIFFVGIKNRAVLLRVFFELLIFFMFQQYPTEIKIDCSRCYHFFLWLCCFMYSFYFYLKNRLFRFYLFNKCSK